MPPRKKPVPVEPGAMKRGKLFRLDKGWVFVTPYPVGPEEVDRMRDYWDSVTSDPLAVLPGTDLMIGEAGQLYVKDVAFAFPEPEVEGA